MNAATILRTIETSAAIIGATPPGATGKWYKKGQILTFASGRDSKAPKIQIAPGAPGFPWILTFAADQRDARAFASALYRELSNTVDIAWEPGGDISYAIFTGLWHAGATL